MKLELVMIGVLAFGAGVAARDIVQPALADARELALMDREIACEDTEDGIALMVRRPTDPDTEARCLLIKRDKPPGWWFRWTHPVHKMGVWS